MKISETVQKKSHPAHVIYALRKTGKSSERKVNFILKQFRSHGENEYIIRNTELKDRLNKINSFVRWYRANEAVNRFVYVKYLPLMCVRISATTFNMSDYVFFPKKKKREKAHGSQSFAHCRFMHIRYRSAVDRFKSFRLGAMTLLQLFLR